MSSKKHPPKQPVKEKEPLPGLNPIELPEDLDPEVAELINSAPDKNTKSILTQVVNLVFTYVRVHRGPLPSGEDLKQIEELSPGLAEKVINETLDLTKEEQKHHHNLENNIFNHAKQKENRTQIIGSILIVLLMVCGVLAMYWGLTAPACVIFGGTIASVLVTWMTGKIQESKSNK